MEIHHILITIIIVIGAVCIVCIFNLCELYYEDYRHSQTLRNRQIDRVGQNLPPPYETVTINPPSYSESCTISPPSYSEACNTLST